MKAKEFKIKDKHSLFYFRVVIYDKLKVMQAEMKRRNKKNGIEDPKGEILGVFQPQERRYASGRGRELPIFASHCIGVISLALDELNTDVVGHEVLHAALFQYRLENAGEANFGKSSKEKPNLDEEEICYMFGYLYSNIDKKLRKYGLWK